MNNQTITLTEALERIKRLEEQKAEYYQISQKLIQTLEYTIQHLTSANQATDEYVQFLEGVKNEKK